MLFSEFLVMAEISERPMENISSNTSTSTSAKSETVTVSEAGTGNLNYKKQIHLTDKSWVYDIPQMWRKYGRCLTMTH